MKRIICIICAVVLIIGLGGCTNSKKDVKIGVSFGVGGATRWTTEKQHMEQRAAELGVGIEARLNLTDEPKTQKQDCFELIDSGIDVLILVARNTNDVNDIVSYAQKKKVKIINYARVTPGQQADLFVGYDCTRIGQSIGQYLVEMVYEGDYIILKGDKDDNNAQLLYNGAMRYINPIRNDINVLLEENVPGWSPEEAKRMVKDAVSKNGNSVDAILAPNDKLAGACAEALSELGVTKPVVITGMDAELDAVKRIINENQDMTMYMSLREMSNIAVDEAVHMAKGETVNINAKFDNKTQEGVDANLIDGQLVTKENVERILVDSGYYTKEQIYGN